MNKKEIVEALATKLDTTKTFAEGVYEAFREILTENVAKGEETNIVGVGKLKVVPTKARTARNLQTGATINVPASKTVKFAVSKSLKDSVK